MAGAGGLALSAALLPCGTRAVQGLRFGDVGFYGPMRILGSSLLESMDFAIVQSGANADSASNLRRQLERVGARVRIVLDVAFHRKEDDLDGPSPDLLETYLGRIRALLDATDLDRIYAVTLGEENVPSRGGARLLTALYKALSRNYSKAAFYQWYAPVKHRLNVPGQQWPLLPADGWVIDHYEMTGERYDALLEGWTAIGKPVINLLWLSPDWRVGRRHKDNEGWWMRDGWRVLYEQLAKSQRHDLPTAFFMFHLPLPGERGLKFYADVDDPQAAAFTAAVAETLIPRLRTRVPLPLPVPEAKPAWIPGWPT